MKIFIGLFMCCLLMVNAYESNAQKRNIIGSVTDAASGKPLSGVTVSVKERQTGTVTDVDGNYSFPVNPGETLMYSFMGMKPQEILWNGKKRQDVLMTAKNYFLEEAVVVAYGNAKKYSLTGALSTIKSDRVFRDLPITTFEQALQGSVAGLTVNPTSGQPGAALNLRIRGAGSLNASQEPLCVIDGIPVIAGNIGFSPIEGDTKAFNIMTSLHPGDIESVTVLKDASAASLYGSRAANGVILITTKQGESGKNRFRFKANWGISDWATGNRETLSGDQQHELTYEAFYNEAIISNRWDEEKARAYAQENADLYAPELPEYSDWKKALFNDHGKNQNYEFSASGGNNKNLYYLSLSYNKEEGMVRKSSLEGFAAKLNMTHKLSDKALSGANISFSKQHSEVVTEMRTNDNPYAMISNYYKPNYLIYNSDGSYNEKFPNTAFMKNLVKEQDLGKNTSDVFRSGGSAWASYLLANVLTLKQTVSYEFMLNEPTLYFPASSTNGKPSNGMMSKVVQQRHHLYSSSLLNYKQTFGEVHHVDVLAGWDVDDRTKKYLQSKGTNYSGDKLPELENAGLAAGALSGYTDDRLLSFISRTAYDYSDQYYFSATYRRDGSSRLGKAVRWGNFWSVAGAWRISSESFMKDIFWINDFKLRLSYGVSGTLPDTEYGHQSLVKYGANYQDQPGFALSELSNPNLSWEKNNSFDVGLDIRLWDKFSVVLDFYNKNTKNLLQSVPVSLLTGFMTSLKNIGAMNNRGIEIDLGVELFSRKIAWSSGFVMAHNRNKITKLYEGKDIVNQNRILRERESCYSFWGREWAGVDPETGEEMWILNTKNEDGSVNRGTTKNAALVEKIVIGKADPVLTGGWRNRITWKGFELNALFSFSAGGKAMDDARVYSDNDGAQPLNTIGVKQWDRWQKPGDRTDVPRRINGYKFGNYTSTRHLIRTDHIRLKNLSLSWSTPVQGLKQIGIKTLRLFVAGSNLLTWAASDDLDPEQPVDGVTNFAFPSLKTCTFGIEIEL